jgi:hypothetical protein
MMRTEWRFRASLMGAAVVVEDPKLLGALLFANPTWPQGPSTTHVAHSVSEIDILPLQAQAFEYTETCAGGQERQSSFRLAEVGHNCICLFGSENHRFVSAGCLAADNLSRGTNEC